MPEQRRHLPRENMKGENERPPGTVFQPLPGDVFCLGGGKTCADRELVRFKTPEDPSRYAFCSAGKSGAKNGKLFHKIAGGGKNPTQKRGTSPYNGEETTPWKTMDRRCKGYAASLPVPLLTAAKNSRFSGKSNLFLFVPRTAAEWRKVWN